MFSMKFNNTIDYFNRALDGTWERNKAISSNIANVNTPNYKRKYVSFEDQLRGQIDKNKDLKLTRTHDKHIGKIRENFTPLTLIDRSDSYRMDNNNVDIDKETADLAKNTIMYDAITRQLSSEFDKVKNVITEGSK